LILNQKNYGEFMNIWLMDEIDTSENFLQTKWPAESVAPFIDYLFTICGFLL